MCSYVRFILYDSGHSMRLGKRCNLGAGVYSSMPLQDKGHLLVAGVGDSRCMLGRLQPDGAIRAVPLSIDHTPDNPTEAARVRLHGVSASRLVAHQSKAIQH